MKKILLQTALFLLFSMAFHKLFSQDTIVHQNGNVFLVELIEIEEEYISYKLWNQENSRTFRLEKFATFSINRKNENEEIIYEFDPERGNIYEVDEMRIFIKGEQDAQAGFKSPLAIIAASIGGAAGGYLLGNGNFIGITALVAVPAIISIFPPKVKEESVRNPKYLPLEPYRLGYKRVAKKKKYLSSLAACAISLVGATIITAAF